MGLMCGAVGKDYVYNCGYMLCTPAQLYSTASPRLNFPWVLAWVRILAVKQHHV